MAEIKWILTCDGECPSLFTHPDIAQFAKPKCPQDCLKSYYEKEQANTEVPDGG